MGVVKSCGNSDCPICPSWADPFPPRAEGCAHESSSGDEGPVADLPGGLGTVVRWRCDGCNAITYDDAALARLRVRLREVEVERDQAIDWALRLQGDRGDDAEREERITAERDAAEAALAAVRDIAERWACDHSGFDEVLAAADQVKGTAKLPENSGREVDEEQR